MSHSVFAKHTGGFNPVYPTVYLLPFLPLSPLYSVVTPRNMLSPWKGQGIDALRLCPYSLYLYCKHAPNNPDHVDGVLESVLD